MNTVRTMAYLAPIPLHKIAEPLDRVMLSKTRLDTLLEIMIEAADIICSGQVDIHVAKERAARIVKIGSIAPDELETITQQMNIAKDLTAAHTEDRVRS